MSVTLHLMPQRGQPYGSERRCCEKCGVMLVARPAAFWLKHTWTDAPGDFRRQSVPVMGDMVPCNQPSNDAYP